MFAHLCYNAHMDTTIRNLDERAYRALKARAALTGRTIGETVNEAIRIYLARPVDLPPTGSLADLAPTDYPPGTERLSEEVDAVVYGLGG
jgi:plasmid stability protein